MPVLLEPRAELRPDLPPTFLLAPGRARPGRMAPPPAHRLLQHPRRRHLPAGRRRLPADRRSAPRTATSAARSRSTGLFYINERWHWGWDVTLLSDKWFLTELPHQEREHPDALPQGVDLDALPAGPGRPLLVRPARLLLPGAVDLRLAEAAAGRAPGARLQQARRRPARRSAARSRSTLNLTSLTREATQFSQIPNSQPIFGLFNGCRPTTAITRPAPSSSAAPASCAGIAGTFTRALDRARPGGATSSTTIGPGLDALRLCRGRTASGTSSRPTGFQNSQIAELHRRRRRLRRPRSCRRSGSSTATPSSPRAADWGTHVVEPIAQVVARPNETRIGRLPNEDAQSLVFDDTTIFDWDKFSGYDRVEGGVRANRRRPVQLHRANGFYANALVGQSYQLAGRNSFRPGDIVNVGRDSGLEVARLRRRDAPSRSSRTRTSPSSTRARFDENDFAMNRLETQAVGQLGTPSLPLIDLGDLRQIRTPARARLRPPARRPSHLSDGQRHAALERRRLAAVRSRPLPELPRHLYGGLHELRRRARRRGAGVAADRPGLSPAERLHADLDRAERCSTSTSARPSGSATRRARARSR